MTNQHISEAFLFEQLGRQHTLVVLLNLQVQELTEQVRMLRLELDAGKLALPRQ